MRKILFFNLIALFICSLGFAQNRLTPEILWKLGRVGEPALSPDGNTVVYSVRNFNLQENKGNTDLYSVSVNGGSAKKLTSFAGNEGNPRWRPDGKKIGFIASEGGIDQLWEMNPDGSSQQKISAIADGLSNFNYAKTGNRIYFTVDVQIAKKTSDLYPDLPKASGKLIDGLMFRHWNQWEDGAFSHVFVADYANGKITSTPKDIMSGEAFDAPLKPFGGEEQLNFSPDGNKIAYTCKKLSGTEYAKSTNAEIYIYDIISGKTENVSSGNIGYDTEPRFSPDGKSIIWLSMERDGFEADKNRIIQLDFATGKKIDLTAGFDFTAGSPSWSADSKNIYFECPTLGTHQIFSLIVDRRKKIYPFIQITKGQFDMGGPTVGTKNGKTILISTQSSMAAPPEIYLVDLENPVPKALTTTNAGVLNPVKMGKIDKRIVKTNDGKDMVAWVVYPPDFDPAKKYPSLLVCQGGPQSMVSQSFSYRWNPELMAAMGYIVIAPNRRGLPGFGQAWNDEISGDWGGQAMTDLLSAIDDLSKEPYIDKNRIACVGASYGGFTTYWMAGNHNKRFRSFISHCGVYNFESMYGGTEEVFFTNFDLKGAPWESPKPKSYEAFSPDRFVRNWDRPILVIHNELDFRVPLNQGLEAFSAAQLRGIESKFLYFPDEGHWVTKPQNSVLWQRVFFQWLEDTMN